MSEFEGAIDYFVDESRVWIDQNDHEVVVCHCTASVNPDQTDRELGDYFKNNALRTSTHYGIDRSGAIAQYVREKDGAGGNGILDTGHDPFWDQYSDNPNWHSLSVECENDVNNSLALTDPQKATLFKLIAYWVRKYNIPLSNIKGHFTLEPVERKNCPGPAFPWDELKAYLANEGDLTMTIGLTHPTVASHFSGDVDNSIWICKDNGFLVGHAILDFYRKFGGDGLCGLTYAGLPKGNETSVHGHPGVVEQEFERIAVRYDPNHELDNPPGSGPVYVIHTDQDSRWLAAQTEIATLKAQLAATTQVSPDQAIVATLRALAPQLTGAAVAIGKL